MKINVLYYLMRLYDLYADRLEKMPDDFKKTYQEINSHTAKDILSEVPSDISKAADALCIAVSDESFARFFEMLRPYADKCRSLLPELSEVNLKFKNLLADEFCSNGYFLKDGVFRKVRKNKLFVIEAELTADFKASAFGVVSGISVFPVVRVAEAPLKTDKNKALYIENGICDDDVTIADIKLFCSSAFYKTLRHLKTLEFSISDCVEINDKDIASLAASAQVASAVCENRAIPHYYKKLCRSDFPFGKAFSLSLISALAAFVVITLFLGLASGIGVYFAMGFTKIFGLFYRPELYIFSAIISAVYGFIIFRKTRSGRF